MNSPQELFDLFDCFVGLRRELTTQGLDFPLLKRTEEGALCSAVESNDKEYFIKLIQESQKGPEAYLCEFIQQCLLSDRDGPTKFKDILIQHVPAMGYPKALQLLLVIPSLDPSVGNNYGIVRAASKGHWEVVKLLLEDMRVNPAVENNDIFMRAARDGSLKIVQLLLDHPKVKPTLDDKTIFDAISLAITHNNHDGIYSLLAKRIGLYKSIPYLKKKGGIYADAADHLLRDIVEECKCDLKDKAKTTGRNVLLIFKSQEVPTKLVKDFGIPDVYDHRRKEFLSQPDGSRNPGVWIVRLSTKPNADGLSPYHKLRLDLGEPDFLPNDVSELRIDSYSPPSTRVALNPNAFMSTTINPGDDISLSSDDEDKKDPSLSDKIRSFFQSL